MRQRVMRIGDADLRIRAIARFARELERDDARDVALQAPAPAGRTSAGRDRHRRRARRPADRDRAADCPLASASACWMRRSTSRTVSRYWLTRARSAGPSVFLQPRDLLGHRIEQAGPLLQRRAAIRRAAAFAEQALEDDPRMRLGRQRRRRRRPGEVVLIDAGVAVVALADDRQQVHRQFERRQLRLVADLLGGDLIDRRAEIVVGALGLLRLGGAQERGVGGGVRARIRVPQLQVA